MNATPIHHKRLRSDSNNHCPGFCFDFSAPKSVICRKELRGILSSQNRKIPELRGTAYKHRFSFADKVFDSVGRVILYLSTPFGIPRIPVKLDVVQAYVPALLLMEILDIEGLIAEKVANCLTKRVKVTYQNGLDQ